MALKQVVIVASNWFVDEILVLKLLNFQKNCYHLTKCVLFNSRVVSQNKFAPGTFHSDNEIISKTTAPCLLLRPVVCATNAFPYYLPTRWSGHSVFRRPWTNLGVLLIPESTNWDDLLFLSSVNNCSCINVTVRVNIKLNVKTHVL